MAITIKVQPQTLQPVYNPIILVLDSDKKGKELFQYVIDVNINGVSQSRLEVQSNPDGYGVIDLHKHIESYVSYDITNPLTDLTEVKKATNSFTLYNVTLSEEYIPTIALVDIVDNGGGTLLGTTTTTHSFSAGDSIKILNSPNTNYNTTYTVAITGSSTSFAITGSFTTAVSGGEVRLSNEPATQFTSSTTFSSSVAFNGVLDWTDFSSYIEETFDILASPPGRLLTSLPNYNSTITVPSTLSDWNNVYEVRPHSRMYLNVWDRNESFNYCQIGSYDINGTLIGSVSSSLVSGSTDNFVVRMALGPWNVNNSGNVTGYGSDFLTGSSYYYAQVTNDEVSVPYLFKIVDPCSKYEDYQFLFMDRLGSFLPVHFDLKSVTNVTMNKSSYKQNTGTYNATSNTWGYNTYDRGKTRLDTKVNKLIKVTSNWVTETQARLIEEMLASPEVYHIDSNGSMFAVDILTNTYIEKTRLNDKLINFDIEFEYSYKDSQQK